MIIIKEVKGKRMLKKFIDFPLSLYKNCPYFTPYLFEDELANLTPGKNPASRYCDFKLFLAYKDNKLIVLPTKSIIKKELDLIGLI